MTPFLPLFLNRCALTIALNTLGWLISAAFETEKVYDATGALSFIVVNATAMLWPMFTYPSLRARLAAIVIVAWSTRLGFFLFRRALTYPDARLRAYVHSPLWLAVLFGFQSAWVLASSLPVMALQVSEGIVDIGLLDGAAFVVCVMSFVLAAVADEQKRQFRRRGSVGGFISTGLWSLSRHPNYFFQIVAAWSLSAFCLPELVASFGPYSGILFAAGPAFESWLILRISGVPVLERLGNDRWGDDARYKRYKRVTPVLVPSLAALLGAVSEKKTAK
jgi:steroid 5-alpha reductase family enzyme